VHPTLHLPEPLPGETKWNAELNEGANAVASLIRQISSLTMFLSWFVLAIQSHHCAFNNYQIKFKGNLQICVTLSKSSEDKRIEMEQNSFPVSFQTTAETVRTLEYLSLAELALSEPDGIKINWYECNLGSLPTVSVHGCLSQMHPVKATCWYQSSCWAIPYCPTSCNHTGESWVWREQCRWQILTHSMQQQARVPPTDVIANLYIEVLWNNWIPYQVLL